MAADRFVSTASISVGVRSGNERDSRQQSGNLRPSPSSFYHTGAQPIHPVLQRRNTPLHLSHQHRRMTQPVSVSFHQLDVTAGNENLSSDKTGKQPIPPPRGPRFKVGLSRNVSQNGLRSPKLSPKQRPNPPQIAYQIPRSPHVLPQIPRSPNVSFQLRSAVVQTGVSKLASRNEDPSRRSRFYVDIPTKDSSDFDSPASTPYTPRKEEKVGVVFAAPRSVRAPMLRMSSSVMNFGTSQDGPTGRLHHPHSHRPSPSFDEIVDEIFKTIGTDEPDYQDCSSKSAEQANKAGVRPRGRVVVAERMERNVDGDDADGHSGTTDLIVTRSSAGGPPSTNQSHARTAHSHNVPDTDPSDHSYSYVPPLTTATGQSLFPYSYATADNKSQNDLPSPIVHRSKSDASRHKLRFKRPLSSLIPTTSTVPDDLFMRGNPREGEWMEESTEVRYDSANCPNKNVMQRMRKSLTSLRSGMLARLQKTPNYARKSSLSCDEHNLPEENNHVTGAPALMVTSSVFYSDALLKPVDPTQNLDRTRKLTSADSGIVDVDGEDASSRGGAGSRNARRESSRQAQRDAAGRPTSTEYCSHSSESPMRRSRSQPPGLNRFVSFATSHGDEKTSDLDRSVSARSSRTSEMSGSSASPVSSSAAGQLTGPDQQNPLYIESLWSQVKYEVDCEQNVAECSLEGMRSNVVKEILKNERDFVDNLKDVIEGYLYKCRQRSDMFSKGRIECIFGNLEQLYEFQCEFLADLEASIITNNVHRSEIGHCFLLHQRGFSDLYSDYCNNHSQSAVELQQLKQIKQYAHFFEACRMLQDMVEISLDGFLLQPVQKICKYPLQLNELLKATPTDHPDCQSVKLALNAMKSVTGIINERKRRLECLEKIALWQETIDLWEGEDLVERSSQLIHYGDLNKLSSKNSWTHDYTFFLFDHQLIYCRRDMIKRTFFTYKGRFDMDQVEIVDLEQNDAGIKHGWVLVCPDKEFSTILLAKSVDEKARWMESFRDERRRVTLDGEHGFAIAPKDRLAAIQTAKMLTAGKEKRSRTKDALKDLTDHTQLVQAMRSKSVSMTLPVRIRVGQANKYAGFAGKLPFASKKT